MRLNTDLGMPVALHAADRAWQPTRGAGVERQPLSRLGGERARAVSLVRFAPGSGFPFHRHPGGEEVLVLEGVFQDEAGDHPAGTYLRYPAGSGHAPASAQGCTIFVRLWHFREEDRQELLRLPGDGLPMPKRLGARGLILHDDGHEQVRVETWAPPSIMSIANPQGLELLVLEGSFMRGGEAFSRHSWLRLPPGREFSALTGPQGVTVWLKAGPLLHADACRFEDA